MSAYFEWLANELAASTQARYASAGARRRRWASRRWPLAAVVAAVAVAGSALAATVVPLLRGGHPLAGRVPPGALASPGPIPGPRGVGQLAAHLPSGIRYAIPVTPDLEAGDTGWCLYPQFIRAGAAQPLPSGGGACGPPGAVVIAGSGAVLADLSERIEPGPDLPSLGGLSPGQLRATERRIERDETKEMSDDVHLQAFVVSDAVAAMRLGSGRSARVVPVRRSPDLPAGSGYVVVFTRGVLTSFSPLLAPGRALPQAGRAALAPVAVRHVDPRHLPSSRVCGLGTTDLPGVHGQWEVVARSAPARGRGAPANLLFSCVRAWYAFPRAGGVYSVAILLNARYPSRRAPSLPGLTPGPTQGLYEVEAATFAQMSARRVGNAWLVVQGPRRGQRDALLRTLTVSGSALRH